MKSKEKTCRQLFDELKGKFTIDQLKEDHELREIFTHLQGLCSRANGQYIYVPGPRIQMLVKKHLDHTYEPSLLKAETT
jgi:hypothetical protein